MRPEPPSTPREPHISIRHSRRVSDPWNWLRDDTRSDPRVLRHLEAENAYTETVLRDGAALRGKLYAEMVGRIRETDRSAAVHWDAYDYYRRTVKGKQYAIHCRRPHGARGGEQVLLDENELAGTGYFRLGALAVSPDHRRLAFAIDRSGDERFTIELIELETGERLGEPIDEATESIAWANDNRTLFYVRMDAAHRPCRLLRHELGARAGQDALVFEETDERYFLDVDRTRDGRYVIAHVESKRTSEERVVDADRPLGEFRVLQPRVEGVEYRAEHRRGTFYILTNLHAVDFRLVAAPASEPTVENWRDVIPSEPGVMLEDFAVFDRHLALVERRAGAPGLRILDLERETQRSVNLPEPVRAVSLGSNPEFDTHVLRYHYESFVTPKSAYDHDMRSARERLRKRDVVRGGYDAQRYVARRLDALASDGARVPISLVHRRDLDPERPAPAVLYGYGAYGHAVETRFSSARLSLLDRGVVWAVAHVRGGGELGRAWYEAGRLQHKPNTFSDFIVAAERLFMAGVTEPSRLAIWGGSAGGLLVGAVLNRRPDLCRTAVAAVPFVDVVTTMLDEGLPLTVTEREEWGDPRDPVQYETIAGYSPYDNVTALEYPDILVTAGLHDQRVAYWEPAKWVARLRDRGTGRGVVLLRTHLEAGHAGLSGRYAELEDLAFEYAFVLDRLGATDVMPRPNRRAPAAAAGET